MAKGRANGEGTVRKRADGRWEGRIVIGHKEDGAPLFKSVFAATQKFLLYGDHHRVAAGRDLRAEMGRPERDGRAAAGAAVRP